MRKATLILAATLVLFGCRKSETATSTTTQTTSTTASTATTAPPPPSSQPATPAAAAPAAGASAATDGEKPGMHIDVTELKRASGGTVNLKFVLTNSTSEKPSFWDYLHEKDVHLVDPVNKKKYFVVVDTEKKCLCSGKLDHMEPNSKVNLWATFPAPPPEVTKVTVEIPHFQPVDDVPISQ